MSEKKEKDMGLKGRTPTKEEKEHMDRVCTIGCIVCFNQGYMFVPCEIHHINGKTKEGCHFEVLPLCFKHHREGNSKPPYISRHPYKKRFEDAYGKEEELLEKVNQIIGNKHEN